MRVHADLKPLSTTTTTTTPVPIYMVVAENDIYPLTDDTTAGTLVLQRDRSATTARSRHSIDRSPTDQPMSVSNGDNSHNNHEMMRATLRPRSGSVGHSSGSTSSIHIGCPVGLLLAAAAFVASFSDTYL